MSDDEQGTPEWFVYCNTTFYPWAEIVKADTAEEAAHLVARVPAAMGNVMADGMVVLPVEAVAFTAGDDPLRTLRKRGRRP